MDTTKLIVEYLIIGILVCLALTLLVFCAAPEQAQNLLQFISPLASSLNVAFIAILLPIAYGLGIVIDFLGVTLYEKSLRDIKDQRISPFVERNLKWLNKNPLLSSYTTADLPLSKGTGDQVYGEMRFFILMRSRALYAEIEGQMNQARILRSLTIVELIFLLGFIIQFVNLGTRAFSLVSFVMLIILLVTSIAAVLNRFHRYCRALERSYKVITLESFPKDMPRSGNIIEDEKVLEKM